MCLPHLVIGFYILFIVDSASFSQARFLGVYHHRISCMHFLRSWPLLQQLVGTGVCRVPIEAGGTQARFYEGGYIIWKLSELKIN